MTTPVLMESLISFLFPSPLASRTIPCPVFHPLSDKVPPLPLTWRQQREECRKRKRQAPSTEGQPAEFKELQKDDVAFYGCNRPLDREPRVPLTLIHRIFGEFVDDAKKIAPKRQDYAAAKKLIEDMCNFHTNEGERRKKLCTWLEEYGIHIYPANIGASKESTDGHSCKANHPILIVEIKNEVGSKGAEPTLQALLYYCVFCDQFNLWDDDSTCHPCLIIFLAGQYNIDLLLFCRF